MSSSPHPSDFIASEFTSTGELEGVFTGENRNGEIQPLIHNKQKYFTVVPRPLLLFGVYNKINYTSFCYNACRLTNDEQDGKTKSLLCFGGGFSRVGSCSAFLAFLVFIVLPFVAAWPFIFKPSRNCYLYLLIVTTCIEFLLFLWHFYCIYTIKAKVLETWSSSWFTFCVKTEILQTNVNNSEETHSFVSLPGKLRVIDVSVPDLCRLNSALHQIKATEREELATVVESHRLDQAVVILYSEGFINEFVRCSMYGIFVLAILSAASTSVLGYLLGKHLL